MKNKLNKYITTNPTKFQIAKDNKWEECLIIDLSSPILKPEEIQNYLDKEEYSYLAIEYQWDQPEGAYVLNIGHSDSILISDHTAFLSFLLNQSKNYTNFNNLISNIDSKLFAKEYLLTRAIDFIRVSIFNYWFPAGPVDIWKKGDPKELNLEKLKKLFAGHENLLETDINFQAAAIAFDYDYEKLDFGARHILKVPSAKKVNGKWILDFELMLKYFNELFNFRTN